MASFYNYIKIRWRLSGLSFSSFLKTLQSSRQIFIFFISLICLKISNQKEIGRSFRSADLTKSLVKVYINSKINGGNFVKNHLNLMKSEVIETFFYLTLFNILSKQQLIWGTESTLLNYPSKEIWFFNLSLVQNW